MSGDSLPLARLEPGVNAIITAVDAPEPLGRRLQDLGLLVETPIRVVRRAPLGDPIEIELRGYRLCLRMRDASRVLVRMDE